MADEPRTHPIETAGRNSRDGGAGEIIGRGRMLRVLAVSLLLALLAMALLINYFYTHYGQS